MEAEEMIEVKYIQRNADDVGEGQWRELVHPMNKPRSIVPRWKICIFTLLVMVVLIVVAGAVGLLVYWKSFLDSDGIRKSAEYMLSNINSSIDPCENFYQFACGSWKSDEPKKWKRLTGSLDYRLFKTYKDILESDINEVDTTALKKAKLLYQNCMENPDNILNGIEEKTVAEILCYMKVRDKYLWTLLQAAAKTIFKDDQVYQTTLQKFYRMLDEIKEQAIRIIKAKKYDAFTTANKTRRVLDAKLCLGFPSWLMNDSAVQHEIDQLNLNKTTRHSWEKSDYEDLKEYIEREYKLLIDPCEWKLFKVHMFDVVNAYTVYFATTIYVSNGYLQRPYYQLGAPAVINYGTLGYILGHELAHVTSHRQWNFDMEVPVRVNILRASDTCLVNHYSQFKVTDDNDLEEVFLDASQSVEESLADLAGLETAFAAYRNSASTNFLTRLFPNKLQKQYTDDQIFFLAYAQTFCPHLSNSKRVSKLTSKDHSPAMIRVLGTLQNFEDFSTAWKCPVGSKMNPVSKCSYDFI